MDKRTMDRLAALAMYEEAGLPPIGGGEHDPEGGDPEEPPAGDPPKPKGGITFTPEQQTFVNSLIKKSVEEETTKAVTAAVAEANKQAEATRAKAMKETLKEQQKWEELAGKLQTEVDTLTQRVADLEAENDRLSGSAAKYDATVLSDYEDCVATMPPVFRRFDPGQDATIDQKRAFVETVREAQSELGDPYQPPAPPSPLPLQPPITDPTSDIEREKAALKRSAQYNRFRVV